MQFDALAGIVERQMPQFLKTVEEARLFRIEPNTPFGSSKDADDCGMLCNFRLPFPVVAVEESRSREDSSSRACMVLRELNRDERTFEFLGLLSDSRKSQLVVSGEIALFPNDKILEPADVEDEDAKERLIDARIEDYEKMFHLRRISAWKGHLGRLVSVPCDVRSINSGVFDDDKPRDDELMSRAEAVHRGEIELGAAEAEQFAHTCTMAV